MFRTCSKESCLRSFSSLFGGWAKREAAHASDFGAAWSAAPWQLKLQPFRALVLVDERYFRLLSYWGTRLQRWCTRRPFGRFEQRTIWGQGLCSLKETRAPPPGLYKGLHKCVVVLLRNVAVQLLNIDIEHWYIYIGFVRTAFQIFVFHTSRQAWNLLSNRWYRQFVHRVLQGSSIPRGCFLKSCYIILSHGDWVICTCIIVLAQWRRHGELSSLYFFNPTSQTSTRHIDLQLKREWARQSHLRKACQLPMSSHLDTYILGPSILFE